MQTLVPKQSSESKATASNQAQASNHEQRQRAVDTQRGTAVSLCPFACSKIQPKLTISKPGDKYEQEADRVADQMIRSSANKPSVTGGEGIMRRAMSPAAVARIPGGLSTQGRSLPKQEREPFERHLGHDLSTVRIQTGPEADRAATTVNARAYTQGESIVFAEGEYQPASTAGKKLLAHELVHVVQQRLGTGTPDMQRKPDKYKPSKLHARWRFWQWWKLVCGFEGDLDGWRKLAANRNHDRGGPTNWGVTHTFYWRWCKAVLGVEPTPEGFENLSQNQAMAFGWMLWRASGADRVHNLGMAIILAEWCWGGMSLDRVRKITEKRGRKATFIKGKLDSDTIKHLNTLDPEEMIEVMSDERLAQYRNDVKKNPKQKVFWEGWLNRTEIRREQARKFLPQPVSVVEIEAATKAALKQADQILADKQGANQDMRRSVRDGILLVVHSIDKHLKAGHLNSDLQANFAAWHGQLMEAYGKIHDLGI